jgi:ubiquinone biosynthesis protein
MICSQKIVFLFNLVGIFLYEILLYFIFLNYPNFIQRLTQKLASINILYVKIFQAIACNNSLINDEINEQLLRFTDNVPWDYNDFKLSELIEIGELFNLNFKHGYEIPINSGMISIVFKAYKNSDDKPVIIKMKRHNIEEKLNEAIQNLLFIVNLLSYFSFFQKYQIVNIIEKNIDIIKQQTNFFDEIENMQRIKYNCRNLKYVVIPEVYKEVTYRFTNYILMDYIEGVKINQIKEEDYYGFAKQVMKFGFVTSIIHGLTHGDLHSGNILFIKNNNSTNDRDKYKIGVLDFGIVYDIDATFKTVLFDVITEMFNSQPEITAKKLLHSGIIEPLNILQNLPEKHYNKLVNFTSEIISESIHNSKKANQIQIYNFLNKFKEFINHKEICSLGLKPSDNFVKTQLVLAMAHGITLTLCREQFITLADEVINELFHFNMIM